MKNKDFCYWLQGYFEISREIVIDKEKILLIDGSLSQINEPFGEFTGWLKQVINFFESMQYRKELLNYFLDDIKNRLNLLFLHVIDNSYEMNISNDAAKKIHDGIAI